MHIASTIIREGVIISARQRQLRHVWNSSRHQSRLVQSQLRNVVCSKPASARSDLVTDMNRMTVLRCQSPWYESGVTYQSFVHKALVEAAPLLYSPSHSKSFLSASNALLLLDSCRENLLIAFFLLQFIRVGSC